VFKVTPTGTLTTLYSFCSETGTTSYGAATCLDGDKPEGSLIQADDGNFYGTASDGGVNGAGTVFKITPSGALTTLYSFCSQTERNGSGAFTCLDGGEPFAGLIQGTDGNFYGTTFGGGTNGLGTLFQITPAGALTIVYSFCSQTRTTSYGAPICLDGAGLESGLIQASDGNFYGTTSGGGATSDSEDAGDGGAGTVFKITPTGALTTLYSFCSLKDSSGQCVDGEYPQGVLIQANDGNFYGTTSGGGASDVLENVAGTVFRITPAGALTTLYSFCSELSPGESGFCFNGDAPQGGVIQAGGGNFYGTAESGGLNDGGAVFKLSVSLVTPEPATLTVSPSKVSFGSTIVTTGRVKTFEVRAKASKASGVSSVFLDRGRLRAAGGNVQRAILQSPAAGRAHNRWKHRRSSDQRRE
jgi:uncharacterized repeat protein (TIGR03803 family)